MWGHTTPAHRYMGPGHPCTSPCGARPCYKVSRCPYTEPYGLYVSLYGAIPALCIPIWGQATPVHPHMGPQHAIRCHAVPIQGHMVPMCPYMWPYHSCASPYELIPAPCVPIWGCAISVRPHMRPGRAIRCHAVPIQGHTVPMCPYMWPYQPCASPYGARRHLYVTIWGQAML